MNVKQVGQHASDQAFASTCRYTQHYTRVLLCAASIKLWWWSEAVIEPHSAADFRALGDPPCIDHVPP
jgi:hypothetical protein